MMTKDGIKVSLKKECPVRRHKPDKALQSEVTTFLSRLYEVKDKQN
jgi:hypothetical protein